MAHGQGDDAPHPEADDAVPPDGSDAAVPDDDYDEGAALAEIDLYAEVVIAAEGSDRPLTQAELDAALGLPEPD